MSKNNFIQDFSKTSFTFENFVVKDTNRFAHACARMVADNFNIAYNPLVIYGPSSVGKTHLARAIENAIREKHPHKTIEFITGEDLNNQIVKALNDGLDIDEIEFKYCNTDMLIIDDLNLIDDKKIVQKEVFNILNSRYENNRQIIITIDRALFEVKKLSKEVKDCLGKGLFADIEESD
jgi:chromosomal replication initiator protein